MEAELLRSIGQIAGIGGISLGVLFLVFREIIRKNIFPTFTDEKLGYSLFRYMIFGVWTVAVLGIGAWLLSSYLNRSTDGPITVSGLTIGRDLNITRVGQIVQRYGEGLAPDLLERIESALRLAEEGSPDRALPILEAAAAETNNPALQSDLSVLYAVTGDIDAAEAASRAATESAPNFEPARENLERLREWRQEQVAVGAMESEPNNDLFTPNELRLNRTVAGAVSEDVDEDYFVFTTPEGPRDWIEIAFTNLSTTVRPHIVAYDAQKQQIAETNEFSTNVTAGQNVSLRMMGAPATVYNLRVRSLRGRGPYQLTVRPEISYDEFEPNDDVFQARPMGSTRSLEASLTDGADVDFFGAELTETVRHRVALENRSPGFRPYLLVYDPERRQIAETEDFYQNVTAGQNVSTVFAASEPGTYYVEVRSLGGSGEYRLSIEAEEGGVP